MKKLKPYNIITIVALVVCVATAAVFGIPGIISYGDAVTGKLVSDTVPRLAASVVVLLLIAGSEQKQYLTPERNGFFKHLLWSVPCFAVAVVNFPFSALIGGAAVIDRTDLIWLFVIKCLSIALLEELFFRAVLLPFALERFKRVKYGTVAAVAVTSAIFGLFHIINLFFGASVGGTFLQIGYTFLLGGMLAVMLIKTKNVWLCVAVHLIFDIGGIIVTDLGHGAFQDVVFWILTAVVGVLCGAFILFELWRMSRAKSDEQPADGQA